MPPSISILTALLLLCSGVASHAAGRENWWPWVSGWEADAAGRQGETQALGPLYSEHQVEGSQVTALRPFWVDFQDLNRLDYSRTLVLYPLYSEVRDGTWARWKVLGLVEGRRTTQEEAGTYKLWPVWFHRDTGDPEKDYQMLLPWGGTVKDFFGRDRVDTILWPIYVRSERDGGEIRYSTPWPFVQWRTGADNTQGWGLWPLYGDFSREGHYERRWVLWPFGAWERETLPTGQPKDTLHVLPLYAHSREAGRTSTAILWPFGGHTIESAPRPAYEETRWLWPFWVQGQGEQRTINYWLPIYGRKTRPGSERRWYAWPILRLDREQVQALEIRRTRLLLILGAHETQRAPAQNFQAHHTSLWPLFTHADNGAGRTQFQTLDPFGSWAPRNSALRETWSPLVAVYRYDRLQTSRRHRVLWNLYVRERDPEHQTATDQLAFLYSRERRAEQSAWSVGNGLIRHESSPTGGRWSFLWSHRTGEGQSPAPQSPPRRRFSP